MKTQYRRRFEQEVIRSGYFFNTDSREEHIAEWFFRAGLEDSRPVQDLCDLAAKLEGQSDGDLKLMCGEMTAGELRTVKAALSWAARNVLSLVESKGEAPVRDKILRETSNKPRQL